MKYLIPHSSVQKAKNIHEANIEQKFKCLSGFGKIFLYLWILAANDVKNLDYSTRFPSNRFPPYLIVCSLFLRERLPYKLCIKMIFIEN